VASSVVPIDPGYAPSAPFAPGVRGLSWPVARPDRPPSVATSVSVKWPSPLPSGGRLVTMERRWARLAWPWKRSVRSIEGRVAGPQREGRTGEA
jgi:hypothetical protein